jgi:uncharacterized pyridoxal phosphate-containing UPF0001 family protein
METIATRLAAIQERIVAAARRVGRSAAEITLVGVTKTQPSALVAEALAAGLTQFGENRVQEGEEKIAALAAERAQITWHLIGHLQRNKAKKAAALFDIVHSVDSLHLAETLARGWGQQPAVLEAFMAEVEALLALPQLRVRGLMTIAPWGADPEQARPTFRAARRLRDELARRFPQADWSALSMGMTDDFEVAIEEGATIVRVGRAIFGERAN